MSDRPKDDKPGIRLPPSGLADEILSRLESGELAASDQPPESGAAPPPPPARAEVDRIYTFTDSLQLGEEEEEEREVYETWVEFRLADLSYALPVEQVQEILRVGELTPVPNAPFPVLGVFNLRGRVVPLLDLRARLGLAQRPPDAASRIVVVESQTRRLGLLVDAVLRVARLARSAMLAADDAGGLEAVRGLWSDGGQQTRLLDLATILTLPEGEAAADGDEPTGDSPFGGD